jgi:hypothetical protein
MKMKLKLTLLFVAIASVTVFCLRMRSAKPAPRPTLVESVKARRLASTPLPSGPLFVDDSLEYEAEEESQASDWLPPGFLACDPGDVDCLECSADYDCPDGQACRLSAITHRVRCVEPDCKSHADCRNGEHCIRIDDASVGEVYGCVKTGPRGRGQTCSLHDPSTACGMGLECLGGVCRGACAEGCAGDEVCADINDRRACVSESCEGVDCPYGDQRCVHGQCVRGLDCRTDACPEGVCLTTGRGLSWTGACYKPCSPWKPCAEGEVCDALGVCLQQCDPRDSESCPESFKCQSSVEMPGVWGCAPE